VTWKRLEAGHVDPEITEGISARIADPLWLLARQWQVGEFRGEDAASPVLVQGTVQAVPVTDYWVEDGMRRHVVPRERGGLPLEALAEHEPVTEGPAAPRRRLESGAALLRRLAATGAPPAAVRILRAAFPFTDELDAELDPVGHARLRLLARRALDGGRLAAAVTAAGDAASLPELASVPDPARTTLASAITAWLEQEAGLFCDADPSDPSAWSASRLEYRFGISAEAPGGPIELEAPEYPGGRLDWFHFDAASVPEGKGEGRVGGVVRKSLDSLPAPLEYAGMPASRWWELEDRDVDFGDLAGGPEDLARSVIAAYGMVAGDDWYVVPCSLPSGSLARVTSLRVLDDFGSWTPIPAAAARDAATGPAGRPWRFFELAGDPGPDRGDAPLLFLPPVVSDAEQGRPLEQVEFRRDEMANLAWAVERRVESEAGRVVDRDAGRNDAVLAEPPTDDAWRYRLSTDVPDHWVPLVPVRITTDPPQIALRRGRLALEPDEHQARGRILEPERPFVLHEEEIPAGGLRVSRRFQLARGVDGGVHLWVGRRKAPSGGPVRRTPLRFDSLIRRN
jgi:hypothetical protein